LIVDLICGAIRETQEKYGMRLIAYSIQSTHLHFIVEVDGSELQASLAGVHVNDILTREELAKRALAKSMKSLLGKVAKRLNKLWRREGQVFGERYHAVVIDNPLQMKRTLEYVLNNGFQHGSTNLRIDPYSSGRYFDGWEEAIDLSGEPREDWPVVPPRTWLAREGWKRHGSRPELNPRLPLQMKRTLEYVLNNGFQHGSTKLRIDPYSSGRYFDGWEEAIELPNEPREDWPVVPARTWLASEGWKRHGPIQFPVAA
jgi:hypothetical protein